MKITAINSTQVAVNHRGNWVFVEVATEEGIIGLGEASHSGDDRLLAESVRGLERELKGEDALGIESINQRLRARLLGKIYRTACSAIEQALWDILGQSLDAPIRALFGGAVRESIRLYANINRAVTDRSPEGFASMAARAVEEGFTAVKLAPFDEVSGWARIRSGSAASWRAGIDRVRAVRRAVGAGIELAVDCHGRFEVSEAIRVAGELSELDLLWFEEPVPRRFTAGLKNVTTAVPMPTASAEGLLSIGEFGPFLTDRLVDVLMPDVKYDGGLQETKSIAEAARARGLPVAPHNPSGPVSTAATAQVASTLENFLILEYAYGEAPWRRELLEPPERIVDGCLVLPDGPGLGHGLNRKTTADHRVR
jgi:galactonate dehydratase